MGAADGKSLVGSTGRRVTGSGVSGVLVALGWGARGTGRGWFWLLLSGVSDIGSGDGRRG